MEFKYCHTFSSQTDYNSYINGSNYVEPCLVLLEDPSYKSKNMLAGKNLDGYNNHGTGCTVTNTVIGETFLGQRVRRWTYTPKTEAVATNFRTTYFSQGVRAPSVHIDSASTGTRKSVYWIYYRPHTEGLLAGGTASNIGGWTEVPREYVGNGWWRVGQCRTKNTSTKTSDYIYTSIVWPDAVCGQTCTVDFVDSGYYISGTTAIPKETIKYNVD